MAECGGAGMTRVHINGEIFRWACERSRINPFELRARFPHLEKWESGEALPTLKQLEKFARAVRAPIGYLFLPSPPEEPNPLPDFRTIAGTPIARPSPDLLETIYTCQERQGWYREYAELFGESRLEYAASVKVGDPVEGVALEIRRVVGFEIEERRRLSTWTEALRLFVARVDKAGVMVMTSGVVGNDPHRGLDPGEFRGFAIADDYAPLIFINGADTKAAQMFTLAHELAHIWLGITALSDSSAAAMPNHNIEGWCNRVAAETLVPLREFEKELKIAESIHEEVERLARQFKVSTLVILRRMMDVGALGREDFEREWRAEMDRLTTMRRGSGGNFYLTAAARVSRRFARAVVESALEGRTSYRDAFHMLGIKKHETFCRLSSALGYV